MPEQAGLFFRKTEQFVRFFRHIGKIGKNTTSGHAVRCVAGLVRVVPMRAKIFKYRLIIRMVKELSPESIFTWKTQGQIG